MSGDCEIKVNKRRYNYMETTLQQIITKISVNCEDKKRTNAVLNSTLDIILGKMRETSPLFAKLYQRHFYGGSYYDNLKTDRPDEFDIDLLLVLTKKLDAFKLTPVKEVPGFVTLQCNTSCDSNEITGQAELFEGEFLSTNKVRKWMEGVVNKALQELPKSGAQNVLRIQDTDFYIKIVKSGPAFTVKLNGQLGDEDMHFDIDLVPCFLFTANMWPQGEFRPNPVKDKTDFFIVPKQPKTSVDSCPPNLCWRMSFQEQERQLMRNSRTLKPCIKLMKKLRDKLEQNSISSYFIKTLFLWEMERKDKNFWENSLSYVFVEMLQIYEKHLQECNIPYYWNSNNNLLQSLSTVMIENYANRIKRIIADIKKNNDHLYVAKFYLSDSELEQLRSEISESRKSGDALSNAVISTGTKNDCKNCACVGTTCGVDLALRELRSDIEAARQEQEAVKVEILNVLRLVVQRLDDLDKKINN